MLPSLENFSSYPRNSIPTKHLHMADHFLSHLQNFKQSFSLSDIDSNMEFMNHLPEFFPIMEPNFTGFPQDNVFTQLPESPGKCFPGLFLHDANINAVTQNEQILSSETDHKGKKRKGTNNGETRSVNSSSQSSEIVGSTRTNSVGRGKKVKGSGEEEGKGKEVVHIRAKRGQATDGHSLAERVRRGKINERLKCLQAMVPGCYKAMGMAVMLDETINYVQSLQNQVEFLSMKLTAASSFHDFHSDIDSMETMQRAKPEEAMKMHKIEKQEYQGLVSSQYGQFDCGFSYNSYFPRNT